MNLSFIVDNLKTVRPCKRQRLSSKTQYPLSPISANSTISCKSCNALESIDFISLKPAKFSKKSTFSPKTAKKIKVERCLFTDKDSTENPTLNTIKTEASILYAGQTLYNDFISNNFSASAFFNECLKNYVISIADSLPEIIQLELDFSTSNREHVNTIGSECKEFLRNCNFFYFALGKTLDKAIEKKILSYSKNGGYIPEYVSLMILEEMFNSLSLSGYNITTLLTLRGFFLEEICSVQQEKYHKVYLRQFNQLKLNLKNKSNQTITELENLYTQHNLSSVCKYAINFNTFSFHSQNNLKLVLHNYLKQMRKNFLNQFNEIDIELVEISPLNDIENDNFLPAYDCSKALAGLQITLSEDAVSSHTEINRYRKQHILSSVACYESTLDRLVNEEVWGSEEDNQLIKLLCCGGVYCNSESGKNPRVSMYSVEYPEENKIIIWTRIGYEESWVFNSFSGDNIVIVI
ncbi:hypothetical protein HK099_008002 [Clydaea vesicula]|uniref:Uncharacterized protein n=1 Tax=Clydaea vesicula TaxID=447962 RepID=A0AAD5XTD9_9FUNG|nr:hypothetical protein HK099_008002 [Clydaea vesicula]